MQSETWFTRRVGADVLRSGTLIRIENEKQAKYYYSLQPYFTFEDVKRPVIHISDQACVACEA